MARAFDDGSSQYLNNGAAIISGAPVSMAAWAKPDDLTVQQWIVNVSNNSGGSNYMAITLMGNVGGDPARFVIAGASSTKWYETSTSYSSGVWHHILGTASAVDSPLCYLDGDSAGNLLGSAPGVLTFDATSIGALDRAAPTAFTSGNIAEAAIWNAALTAAEADMLALGVRPIFVRPQSLVAYWPLMGNLSPEPDLLENKYSMTLQNAPTKADHPPVMYPVSPYLIHAPTAAADIIGPFPTFFRV